MRQICPCATRPVFQDKSSNAIPLKPFGDIMPLGMHIMPEITATGANYNCYIGLSRCDIGYQFNFVMMRLTLPNVYIGERGYRYNKGYQYKRKSFEHMISKPMFDATKDYESFFNRCLVIHRHIRKGKA